MVNNCISEWSILNGSVPQGTLHGLLLFITMIDDLHTCLPDVKYVDDTTLYETVLKNDVSVAEVAVKQALEWATKNNMRLNADKTKELVINFTKKTVSPTYVDNVQLDKQSEVKLLGLTISHDLTWRWVLRLALALCAFFVLFPIKRYFRIGFTSKIELVKIKLIDI